MNRFRLAFLLIALAVCLGAFGAHALKSKLTADAVASWQTAVLYLFIHSIAILLISHMQEASNAFGRYSKTIIMLLITGNLLFCGSIFILTTREIHHLPVAFAGPLTPIGGICFIVAWCLAAFTFRRNSLPSK